MMKVHENTECRVIKTLEFMLNRAVGSVMPDQRFGEDIILDSLDDHEILCALEVEFNRHLEPSLWDGVSKVSDLVENLRKHQIAP